MTTTAKPDAWANFGVKLEQLNGSITVLRTAYESGNLSELAATTFMHSMEAQAAALQDDFLALARPD